MPLKQLSSMRAHTLLCAYSSRLYPHVSASESLISLAGVFVIPARPFAMPVMLLFLVVAMAMAFSLAVAQFCRLEMMSELPLFKSDISNPKLLFLA